MCYVVKYTGPFGFIKPWTAVRDSKTFSQQFLTPSIIEGIRQKLEVNAILRHRLSYKGISMQQEKTQSRGWKFKKQSKTMIRSTSILERGVMLEPILHLAFQTLEEAEQAASQHICLCRNEDVLLPDSEIRDMSEDDFNQIAGFELKFEENKQSFLVGFNRFDGAKPMHGYIEITGKPVDI